MKAYPDDAERADRRHAIMAMGAIVAGLLVMAAAAGYATAWPRLAPGTQVDLVIPDNSISEYVPVRLADHSGEPYMDLIGDPWRVPVGTRAIVLDDSRGTFLAIWNRLRRVRVRLDRTDVPNVPDDLATVERLCVAPVH